MRGLMDGVGDYMVRGLMEEGREVLGTSVGPMQRGWTTCAVDGVEREDVGDGRDGIRDSQILGSDVMLMGGDG